jgi:multidrug efflux pump subunit AcrA (membrane-fusion protein)
MSAPSKRIRLWFTFIATLLLLAGAAAGFYRFRGVHANVTFPVAAARKGDFFVMVRARGEIKAARSVGIYAPLVPSLRIAWLAPSGETIKPGDLCVKFDSSASEQQLEQKEAQLRQAQATLDQAVAQSKITSEQDKSDLADSRFTVEKARLEASKTEIVSKIQGEEDKIDLGVAEQKFKVEQATVDLHAASDRAKIGSLTRLRDQAQFDVNLTRTRIAQMQIRAPIPGMIVFLTNYSQGWMNAKPYKVGDNVCAGCQIGEIPDLQTLEMEGKIDEIDRGRIAVGQDVKVRVDSLPELTLPAKVALISPLAELSYEWPPTRSFRAYAPLAHPDPRLRTGMNAGMDIIIDRVRNAISIPAKALFTHAGKPIVYIGRHGSYRATQITVLARNPDEVAVSGIPPDAIVALVDISKQEPKK